MRRFPALFFLLFISTLLDAQSTVAPIVSSREDLQHRIGRRQLERSRILTQMKTQVNQTGFSPNTQFHLSLTLDNLRDIRQPALESALAQLAKKRNLAGLDLVSLRRLEGELIRVNTGLYYLQELERRLAIPVPHLPKDLLASELSFYDLQDGERIGELGAGNTDFLRAALAGKMGMVYHLNDIDEPALGIMAAEVALQEGFTRRGNRIRVVRGTESSSGLEFAQLDKVIIRNALHHFSAIPDMLQSVKESLKPGGKLLLKESFPELCGVGCCEYLLPENRLFELLEEAGFRLEREEILIDPEGFTWKLLRFSIGDS